MENGKEVDERRWMINDRWNEGRKRKTEGRKREKKTKEEKWKRKRLRRNNECEKGRAENRKEVEE